MPELMFDSRETVPEPFREVAVEKDGKYAINVVNKSELDEFRNRNTELARERDGFTSLFGRLKTDAGLEPEKIDDFLGEITTLRDIKRQVDDGKLVADSSLEEAVKARTEQMKAGLESQVNQLKTVNTSLAGEVTTLKTKLQNSQIDQAMMDAINDPNSGALPAASKQILREAREIFTIDENGDLVPKDSRGNIMYGSDGATPMTPKEFLSQLETTSPFFFKASQGGGAGGSGSGGGQLSAAQLASMSPEEKMNYGRQHGMNR